MIDDEGNSSYKKWELDWNKNNRWDRDPFYFGIERFEFLENAKGIATGAGHIIEGSS